MNAPGKPTIHVACGVLVNAAGEVLLARRPEGKVAAGYWEFPGGKIEPGETALQALARELDEELGVRCTTAEPLIRFAHAYTNRTVVLDTWRITAFAGEPQPREGQALAWVHPARFGSLAPQLPTVVPIARSLQLPAHYVFTPPTATLDWLAERLHRLPPGALLRLRQPGLPDADYRVLAEQLRPAAQAAGLQLVLDRDPAMAVALGADGWHATSAALAATRVRPPLPLVIASVHDAAQLAAAERLGCDAAVLGPVRPTPTHPDAEPLGWPGFQAIRDDSALAVYALGGLGADALPAARAANAQGVAGISAYWRD